MGVIENRIDITELERSGGGGGGGTAASVSYNNTSSHMTATNVQAALDELNLDVADNRAAITATQENLAPVEDGATSSAAYSVGDYLVHQNVLMEVIATIAIRDTLSTETNLKVAQQINGKRILLDSTNDLNDVTNSGKYFYNAVSIPANMPTGAPSSGGYLNTEVLPAINITEQTLVMYSSGEPYIYKRRKYLTNWSAWYRVTLTVVS